jgi:peptidoglycan LD-endopeptidase LytH
LFNTFSKVPAKYSDEFQTWFQFVGGSEWTVDEYRRVVMNTKALSTGLVFLLIWCGLYTSSGVTESAQAAEQISSDEEVSKEEVLAERMTLYEKFESLTQVPWYYLAAIDQYERNIQRVRDDLEEQEGPIAITVPADQWAGILNPNQEDDVEETIRFFAGIGRDGNGDGKADRTDPEDILYTLCSHLIQYGLTEDDFRIALWEYYGRDQTAHSIHTMSNIYRHFQTLDLDEKAFVLDKRYNYSYRSTWGARRGWGGRRIHEGTDLFADYGTPVRSSSYGQVTIKGWNRFGGWRIGIRDIQNNYHYYAHLSRFEEGLEEGDLVEPGQVIGYVGTSGNAPDDTPHLHFAITLLSDQKRWWEGTPINPYLVLK